MSDLIIQEEGGVPLNAADAFAQMSLKAKERRRKKTPKAFTKTRQGKGGKAFTYVDRRYVEQWLDDNFPIWSFEVVASSVHTIGDHVHVLGVLTVIDQTGAKRTLSGYGAKEAIPSGGHITAHPYLKSAESDALKRCAAMLGCAADIYNAELKDDTDALSAAVADTNILLWYANQIPTIVAQYKLEKIHNLPAQFTALAQGKITKEQIIASYGKLGINLEP